MLRCSSAKSIRDGHSRKNMLLVTKTKQRDNNSKMTCGTAFGHFEMAFNISKLICYAAYSSGKRNVA